ncbi:MAG: hypothetical protein QCI82_06920 [Candidatus Thermoplasmatota archaeon]|nr:hypothetical protein [Candidatus Thermoplasmatota archaeon]
MSDERKIVSRMFSSSLEEIFGGEDLILEVARDMIKDEIKGKVKKTLNEDPDLKAEFKDALEMYYEAKIRQAIAAFKIAKASARLGVKMAPEDIQEQVHKEIETEINRIIDDTL